MNDEPDIETKTEIEMETETETRAKHENENENENEYTTESSPSLVVPPSPPSSLVLPDSEYCEQHEHKPAPVKSTFVSHYQPLLLDDLEPKFSLQVFPAVTITATLMMTADT